jgi:hypothetical protein
MIIIKILIEIAIVQALDTLTEFLTKLLFVSFAFAIALDYRVNYVLDYFPFVTNRTVTPKYYVSHKDRERFSTGC